MKKLFMIMLLICSLFLSFENVSAEEVLDCSKLLRRGSKSSHVKMLQKELNEVMNCKLDVDGIFGKSTKNCVLSFQKKNSLSQDGMVGVKTCTKLNKLYLDSTSVQTLNTTKTLARGNSGKYVKTLQSMLNELSHCNLTVDGIFGYKTEWCVKKYQEEMNLAIDGKVRSATRKSLNKTIKETDDSKYVIVTKTSNRMLNVRKGPSVSYKDIGDVYTSEIYKIHGSKITKGTTWYKIEYKPGKYGYISGDYASQDFVLLDISSQNIKLYRDGQVIFNVPTITGNKSKGYDTRLGVFKIGNKISYLTQGQRIHLSKYDAYVDYWIPFIRETYGFHDADWRSIKQISNGTTYLKNGSHGCVNMLLEDAKFFYDNVYKNLEVHIVE